MVSAGFGSVAFGPFVLCQATRELGPRGESIHLMPEGVRPSVGARLDSALVPSPSPNSTNAYGRKRSSTRQTCRSSSANPSRAGRFGAQAYLHSPAHGFGYALLRQTAGVDEPAGSRICGSTRCLVSRTREVALHQGENIVGREPSSEVWLGAHSISRTRIIVTTREITAVEGAAKQEWHLAEAAPH